MSVLKSLSQLEAAGLMPPGSAGDAALEEVARRYSIALTPAITAGIAGGSAVLARQFLPSAAELVETAEERSDPIGDRVHEPVPGIVHRYPDRCLLMVTRACAVYCRYCFRREAVGAAAAVLPHADMDAALDYIAATPGLREVILSGGDPLVLSERRLRGVLERLDAMPHLELLRIHTRVPSVAPERVTESLADLLGGLRLPVWLAVHANHVDELGAPVAEACRRLARAGVPLLGQSVLLAGVNDNVEALEALLRRMIALRIKPYYLHHPDPARGTGHFRVSVPMGQSLMRALRGRLSGLAHPTYVLDIPGGFGKVPLTPPYWQNGAVEDIHGAIHTL